MWFLRYACRETLTETWWSQYFGLLRRLGCVLENLSIRINRQTHARPAVFRGLYTQFALGKPVTLIFDLLTSWSLHACGLLLQIFLPTLVLIARAVFLLQHEHTQTHKHTQCHRRNCSPCPGYWLLPACTITYVGKPAIIAA